MAAPKRVRSVKKNAAAAARKRARNAADAEEAMLAYLQSIDLEWSVELAKVGDREPLTNYVRKCTTIPEPLHGILIDIVSGKTVLQPQVHVSKTYRYLVLERNYKELFVDWMVNTVFQHKNRKRDPELRTKLIEKYCNAVNLNKTAYNEYRKRGGHKPLSAQETRKRMGMSPKG